MRINPEIFRGYDIRGIWGKDLDKDVYEIIGKAYGTWLKKRRIVDAVVGYDSRESSVEAKNAFNKGLLSTGVNIFDMGMSLTGMVYWAQYHFKANGGAMITASHNPREFNGIKMCAGFSSTFIGDEMIELREIVDNEKFIIGNGICKKVNIKNDFYNDILKRVSITKRFRIALDTANGTPGLFTKELLEKTGCEVIEFNTKIDGTMPLGTADPTENEFLDRLSKETLEANADLGLALDTDGDRFGLVDEIGRKIWNDVVVAMIAKDIIEYLPGAKIVYNSLCSKAVTETIEAAGGCPIMWITGHSFIKQKVTQERAPFGGELSGHFFFADNYYGFDDGFYTVLRLLQYLSKQNKKVSELVNEMPYYISSPETKVTSADNVKFDVIKRLIKKFKNKFPYGTYYDIDGIRVDLPDGMAIIRASHNGPYLAIKYEAKTQKRFDEIGSILADLLNKDKDVDVKNGINNEVFLK